MTLSFRCRQNLDRTGSDQGLDLAPDHGLNHGPDHGSNHGSWIGPCKIKFLCDKPKQSVSDKIEGGPLWEFFFGSGATMDEGKREVCIISSVS